MFWEEENNYSIRVGEKQAKSTCKHKYLNKIQYKAVALRRLIFRNLYPPDSDIIIITSEPDRERAVAHVRSHSYVRLNPCGLRAS